MVWRLNDFITTLTFSTLSILDGRERKTDKFNQLHSLSSINLIGWYENESLST